MLSYKIENFTPDIPVYLQASEIRRAFDLWAKYIPLRFVRTYGTADIDIKFAVLDHGDGNPFDGPGNINGHAFYPRYGGDVHLNDDQTFTAYETWGVNLFQVVAHEIGHALGLEHTNVSDALMWPYDLGYIRNFQLHPDDIAGIRAIYGANPPPPTKSTGTRPTTRRPFRTTTQPRTIATRSPRTTPTPTPRTLPTPSPTTRTWATPSPTPGTTPLPPPRISFCSDGAVDAITVIQGWTYAFHGDEYALLTSNHGIMTGYPRSISQGFPGVGGNLDAALYWPGPPERSFLFKGGLYWMFHYGRISPFPRRIRDGFPGVPDNLDAVFVWGGDGHTYFIKGYYYYRFTTDRGVASGYPRPLSDWRGLPARIDA